MDCGYDEIPNSAILLPIVFASRNLSSGKQHYRITEHEALRILHWLEKNFTITVS